MFDPSVHPPLSHNFYCQPTEVVARQLLGAVLMHSTPAGLIAGRIVETEAYVAHDAASHAFKGPTPRNRVMFGPPGTAYVYLIYGRYYCFNVVTQKAGVAEAVLIRALEPLIGIDLMQANRGDQSDLTRLCRGPGLVCEILGITKQNSGQDLTYGSLTLASDITIKAEDIVTTARIGLSVTEAQQWPLRFMLKNSPYVSRPVIKK